MKTIFITLTRGTLARNILRSGVLDFLLKHDDIRIVLIIPRKIFDYFRKEFNHPRIVFEIIPDKVYPKWRKFFIILFNGLVYTDTEHRMLKYGGGNKKPASRPIYWIKHITFSILSKVSFLKRIARWVENRVFVQKDYDYLFDKYSPNLVFCSSIYSKPDVIFIKAAKRLGVLSVSMPKSWDTVGRLFFRVRSDKLIVNNNFMSDWIVKQQLIPEKDIIVCGIPQFDVYKNKQAYLSKEAFCEKTDLDPKKPIVLYASEGLWTHWDYVYVRELIEKYKILDTYNLIIRPHFSNTQEKLYDQFKELQDVYIDDKNVALTNMFGDKWDPTKENMDWLAEVLHVSDVVVTFMTTFVLDTFVNEKPVINIYYDLPVETKNNKPIIPMSALYNCTHYNAVLDEKSTVLAKDGREVMEWVGKFVDDPKIFSEKRRKTVDKLCYKVDGKSSYRIYQALLTLLN